MAKYLKDILGDNIYEELRENYTPFPEDERRFYEKHGLELGKEGEPPIKFPRFDNMYSDGGKYNADKLFKGATKTYDRPKNRHGYAPGKDQEHYEEYVEEASRTERWMEKFAAALPNQKNINWDHAVYHMNKGTLPNEAAKTHEPLKPKPFGSGMKIKEGYFGDKAKSEVGRRKINRTLKKKVPKYMAKKSVIPTTTPTDGYNKDSVDKQMNRDGVKGKARKLTHALLKGRGR